MINFNVPPCTGKEIEYIKEAIASHKICGDGAFTKKCHAWLEERFASRKMLLSIVFFFVIHTVFGVVSSGWVLVLNASPLQAMMDGLLAHSGGAMRMTHLTLCGLCLPMLVQSVVYYFLTWLPLARRLNLE